MSKVDFGRPFLVINDSDAEIVVNPLDVPITNISLPSSGLESGAVGIASVTAVDRIEPRGSAVLRESTWEEYQEMVCDWDLHYEVNGETFVQHFAAGKGLNGSVRVPSLPYVGGPGYVISLDDIRYWPIPIPGRPYEEEVARLPDDVRLAMMTEAAAAEYEKQSRPKRKQRTS